MAGQAAGGSSCLGGRMKILNSRPHSYSDGMPIIVTGGKGTRSEWLPAVALSDDVGDETAGILKLTNLEEIVVRLRIHVTIVYGYTLRLDKV